ncbi:MAG: GNAT family N-acetyltransferase, partial [Verrucomicrobiota bacterium]
PTRATSLPFTALAPPLLFANTTLPHLLPSLQNLAHQRHWNSFELRGPSLSPPLTPSVQFYTHELDLQPHPQIIDSHFSTSTRRAIRKSQKSPLQVEISQSKSALLQFYQLHELTRRHHGVPPQPLRFFLHIYEEILQQNLGWIVIAHHHRTPAAAAIFFLHHHHAIYKFGASDRSLQHLHPNHLVFATAIHHLHQLHAHSLHFGRTSLHNEGLRRFKKSWGTTETIIDYSKFHLPTNSWITSRDSSRGLHNSLFSHLPLPLNRLAGSLLYPHLD